MHPLIFLLAFGAAAFFVVKESKDAKAQQALGPMLGPGDTDPVWLIPAALVNRDVLKRRLEDIIIRMALKTPMSKERKDEGVRIAQQFKLPLTARGMLSESALPTTEAWPDTTLSVAAYIKQRAAVPR